MTPTAPRHPQDLPPLTPLQRDVLIHLVDGLTNWEIATRLDLTPGRIGTQVGRIVQLLGLTRRADIAAGLAERGDSSWTLSRGDGIVSAQGPKTPGPWAWRWLSTAFLGSASRGHLRRARRELRGACRLPYQTA
jgi:DNA-binding CsgD family transcriptional regulator